MGAVELAVAAVPPGQRHRSGLAYANPLAGNPAGALRWGAAVTRADGSRLTVADPVVTRLIVSLMDMNAVMGGAACHFGGPAALAELMSAIHGVMYARPGVWHQHFNFVNDAGHTENGVYALKANYGFAGLDLQSLKAFRSITSKLTGHGESHLFPEGVMVSNGPLGSSIPISQGLCLADRLADNARTTVCVISDGAMMEGETKEAIAAIPGFAAKGLCNPYVLVLSDNNTKLSGRIDADAFSMHPYFTSLAAQGWQVVRCEHGNDLQQAFSAVETAIAAAERDRTKPVVLWAKTVKGFGVAAQEKSASGGHGFPLAKPDQLRPFVAEINHGKPLPAELEAWLVELEAAGAAKAAKDAAKPAPAAGVPAAPKKDKIQAGFPKAMIAAAEKGLPVVSVSADLQGSTGVAPFRQKYPQLSFEVGVAEANMVSTAAGFSKQGYMPVVDTFAQFGVTKGLLPLCMATLSQSPVIAVFSHTGFQDAADGASHQGLQYLAMTGAIPHVEQYCPASPDEAQWAMAEAISRFAAARAGGHQPDSVLFFVGRENFAPVPARQRPELRLGRSAHRVRHPRWGRQVGGDQRQWLHGRRGDRRRAGPRQGGHWRAGAQQCHAQPPGSARRMSRRHRRLRRPADHGRGSPGPGWRGLHAGEQRWRPRGTRPRVRILGVQGRVRPERLHCRAAVCETRHRCGRDRHRGAPARLSRQAEARRSEPAARRRSAPAPPALVRCSPLATLPSVGPSAGSEPRDCASISGPQTARSPR